MSNSNPEGLNFYSNDMPIGLLVALGRESCKYQDKNLNCKLCNNFCPYVADEDCKKETK